VHNVPLERRRREPGTLATWGAINVPSQPADASGGALSTSPPARAASTAAATSLPETSSGSVLRWARANTNAPSSALIIAIVSSRARPGDSPASSYNAVPACTQLSNTSAHACRSVSLVLETSSATVAIGQASS
jgi:hypothetical protein